jgi:hypothetical protein
MAADVFNPFKSTSKTLEVWLLFQQIVNSIQLRVTRRGGNGCKRAQETVGTLDEGKVLLPLFILLASLFSKLFCYSCLYLSCVSSIYIFIFVLAPFCPPLHTFIIQRLHLSCCGCGGSFLNTFPISRYISSRSPHHTHHDQNQEERRHKPCKSH